MVVQSTLIEVLRVWAIAALLASSLASCTLGGDYHRPALDIPPAWRLGATESAEISNVAWWDQFQDSVLSELVRTALANNRDLKIATANVDEAYARYGIIRSAQLPEISLGASATREKSSANTRLPGGARFSEFNVNLSASFELDVWGRLRRATESARASVLASVEGRGAVVLTVVTSVATGYIELRALDRQLDVARSSARIRGEAAQLQRIRFQEGIIPESDYRQTESQYRDATARIPELERAIARQENFISVLIGRNPDSIARGRAIDELLFPTVPGSLPATLLERRPDIRQAEEQLKAANANIGVAKAALFPEISLTALLGLASAQLSSLFQGPSRAWSFGGGVFQSVFNGGRLRSQLAQAEAIHRQTFHNYERTIISGFQDVENALVDRVKFEQVRDERAINLAALRRFRDLAELRYREGATLYLEVANAEQLLLNAELDYVTAQSQYFQSYANLYRAMGGGWTRDAEALTPGGVASVSREH
jgi:outer membrane protein, multidrug efflux system